MTVILNNPHYLTLLPIGIQFASLILLLVLIILTMRQPVQVSTHLNGYDKKKIKASGHISWNEYFMSVAQLAAQRSKDPATKVGACIVNDQNKIVATGYNGMPNGINDSLVPWVKEGPFLDTKYAYVVHAELNAILNSILTDQTGCRLFVSLFPCNECAKAIIQTGIKHVIYLSDKHKEKDSTKAAKKMFKLAGVHHEQFQGCLLI